MLAPCSGGGGLSAPSLEQLPRAQAPAAWLSYATLQIEAAPTYSIKDPSGRLLRARRASIFLVFSLTTLGEVLALNAPCSTILPAGAWPEQGQVQSRREPERSGKAAFCSRRTKLLSPLNQQHC